MMTGVQRAIAGVLVAGALVLGSALPAAAHGGAIHLELAADGAGGVSIVPTYERDGHPVEEIVNPVLTATSASGKKVGPVHLVSSAEGIGLWVTENPVLEEGLWTVTVSISEPSVATVTTEMEVVPLAEPIVGEKAPAAVVADEGPPVFPVVLGGLALAVLASLVLLFLQLRRRSAARAAGGLLNA